MQCDLSSYNNDWYVPGSKLKIAFWFLISIIFKSHVLGRDISKFKLIQSTLKSLFFFSGFVSILNLLFFQLKFYLTTINSTSKIVAGISKERNAA